MIQIQHKRKSKKELHYDYLVFLPENYRDSEDEAWPFIMFLHGAFQRGDELEIVKEDGLPKLATKKEYPFIIAAPQCPYHGHWQANPIEHIIDEVTNRYAVDASRIYITGFSMGGFATWQVAMQNPAKYAAIIPVCGGGNTAQSYRLIHIPVWAFHGKNDKVISVENSIEMVDAINEKGGNAKLTIYPDGYHDVWTQTYANEEIYSWFLSHKSKI